VGYLMDWLWNFAVSFALSTIPTWVWVVIAGVLIGAAWRTFGWQGVVGGALAILTLGAYRQGWRDRDASKPPLVPVEDYERAIVADPPKPRRKTLVDLFDELRRR
jgi:hypothetical protein